MLANPEKEYTKSLWSVRSIEKQEEESEDIILRVDHIDASYTGSAKVLDDVSIEVPRGHTVAIVGESGSGKSTAARAITGLLPPSKGQILYNGKPLPPALKERSVDRALAPETVLLAKTRECLTHPATLPQAIDQSCVPMSCVNTNVTSMFSAFS